MGSNRTRLELTWIGKDKRPRLEPRVLLEDPARSYHAPHRVTDHDHFDNRLIFGDNLLALKALEQEFTGKIKCIYIDPPYNTQHATAHESANGGKPWHSLLIPHDAITDNKTLAGLAAVHLIKAWTHRR